MVRILFIISIVFCTYSVADNDFKDCGNNKQARLLAELIINDTEQQRSAIRCNKLLTDVAQQKAELMVERGLVMHNLGGSPNERLRSANYQLPDYYGGALGYQVEAIAGGYSDAEDVWDGFKDSFGHRQHLLGEHELYRERRDWYCLCQEVAITSR